MGTCPGCGYTGNFRCKECGGSVRARWDYMVWECTDCGKKTRYAECPKCHESAPLTET